MAEWPIAAVRKTAFRRFESGSRLEFSCGGISSDGRAPDFGSGGRGFEPRMSPQPGCRLTGRRQA